VTRFGAQSSSHLGLSMGIPCYQNRSVWTCQTASGQEAKFEDVARGPFILKGGNCRF
jgi:hypothetical protein